MPTDDHELKGFLQRYHRAMESGLDALGRDSLAYHGEQSMFVAVYKAADGAAVFYMAGAPENAEPGIYVFDHSSSTLNEVLQSLHLHRLQLKVPEVGAAFSRMDGPIEYTAAVTGIDTLYFSPAAREALLAKPRSAPGLTVAPIYRVTDGVVTEVHAGRVKLWSPVVAFPGAGPTRYFAWIHADIWWGLDRLSLPDADLQAQQDLAAFAVLQTDAHAFGPERFGPDSNASAARILKRDMAEFGCLLDSDPSEHAIHEWLVGHQHFIDPQARRVLSKVPFGSHVSDFVVERADGGYELIEIEGVQRIFTASGSEPCALFNHACGQVRDWMRYINENLRTVQSELELPTMYQPSGRVIMGRSQHIDTDRAEQKWKHLKSETLAVDTYDDLTARIAELARTLDALTRPPRT